MLINRKINHKIYRFSLKPYNDSCKKIEDERQARLKDATVDGVKYKSLTAAAKTYGLNPSSVRDKVYWHGYTVEDAIHSLAAFTDRAIVHGVKYKTYIDACRFYNVQVADAMYYQKKYKISFEEAIDKLIGG